MTRGTKLAVRLLLPACGIAICVLLAVAAVSWSAHQAASQADEVFAAEPLARGLLLSVATIALGLATLLVTWWILLRRLATNPLEAMRAAMSR